MLGELIAEASGKITVIRMLPTEGAEMHFEVSIQGRGKLLGADMTDVGSYHQVLRLDGTLFCPDGHVAMFTAEGGVAHWSGFALGQPAGKAPAARLAVCGRFQTNFPKLARLNGVANVVEYEVAEDGSYRWKMWEWKPGQA